MKDESENRLAEEFPFMRRKEQPDKDRIDDLYSAFGCECGEGWYEVIHGLCSDVDRLYKEHGEPLDFKVSQVKEKFGTLRFYFHLESTHERNFTEKLYDIVSRWEEKSAFVCEECGKPGRLREDLPWIQTLCEDCYIQSKIKRRNFADGLQ